MKKRVILDKPIGQTPLEAIQSWKTAHPEYAMVPASYAGRLDPMASGKLLVLLGDECKRQATYHTLDKEYEIEVVLGIGSDTGDVLGIVRASTHAKLSQREVRRALRTFVGSRTVPYPIFSSKTVGGKPLFLYALEHTLHTIAVPTHTETLYSVTLTNSELVESQSLQRRIETLLDKAPVSTEPSKELGADFRISEVRASWKDIWEKQTVPCYRVLTLRISCASGAYMRTLASDLGKALGTDALALSIHRSRIGRRPFWLL